MSVHGCRKIERKKQPPALRRSKTSAMEMHKALALTVLLVCWLLLCLKTEGHSPQNVRWFSANNEGSEPASDGVSLTVTVDVTRSLNFLSRHFIGVTIDAGQVVLNWSTLDFGSPSVQNMGRALSPSYFRLGGGYADGMNYDFGPNPPHPSLGRGGGARRIPQFNLTAQNWDAVNGFSQKAGWDFIMDLNALKRNADGSWDPENARQLLNYSAEKHYPIVGFELGNEYDLDKGKFNRTISPSQLAKDVATLRTVLSNYSPYDTAFLIGPEVASDSQKYFQGFLSSGGAKVVRAASFHHYYFGEAGSHLSDFTSIQRMEELEHCVDNMLRWSREVDPLLPVWLSETSTASHSGTPNISDRFVAGFLWLDKLGVCASKGIQTVIRQAFYGGHYSLINASLQPNPDFWLTVLFKRVVRGAVFNTTVDSHNVRVYAACANTESFPAGSVVVYALNPNPYPVTLNLPQFSQGEGQLWVYQLTAGDDLGLVSKLVSLNGVPLRLVSGTVPELSPRIVSASPVTMETYSFMFVVVPTARAVICQEQP